MSERERWFEVREFPDRVVGIGEPGHVQRVKSFLVEGDDLAMLVDSGTGIGDIGTVVRRLTAKPVLLVNSHSHWDHVGDNWQFDRIWIHEAEASRLPAGVPNERMRLNLTEDNFTGERPAWIDPSTFEIRGSSPERLLHGGEVIDLGGRQFTVIHTPGHSPGGIVLLEEATGILIAGDAVYAGRLFAHLADSDPRLYRNTINRLADLAPSVRIIYPSHGDYPLPAAFLHDVQRANESVWAGKSPDAIEDGVERYLFGQFSILLREGWRTG
jgi:glyoxylase-like metal-dependent hydrolase (beta-lactamase superfamily II)